MNGTKLQMLCSMKDSHFFNIMNMKKEDECEIVILESNNDEIIYFKRNTTFGEEISGAWNI